MRKLSVIVILVLLMSALMAGTAFAGHPVEKDIAEPDAHQVTGVTLLNQPPGGKWVFDSISYAGSGRTVNTAGDFSNAVVWQIDKIIVYGMNADGNGLNTASSFNWCVWSDAGLVPPSVPAAPYWCYAATLNPNGLGVTHNSARITIDVVAATGSMLSLPPGKWWLLAWPTYPGNEQPPGAPPTQYNAQWYWKGSTPTAPDYAALWDPSGLWELNAAWIPWTATVTPPLPVPNRDMAFVLEGVGGGTPAQVWVDLNANALWCAAQGHLFGFDCFTNVQSGIGALTSGGTVYVGAGVYNEAGQIVIGQNITVIGQGCGATTIMPLQNTGSSGDARGWWLVNPTSVLNLSNVTLDGTGFNVYQGLRIKGGGTISGVCFNQMLYPGYMGNAVAAMGDLPINISGCSFTQIGRIGVIYFGSGVNGSVYDNNVYTGKGTGDWLDYGVELGGGAQATVSNSSISNNLGVASSDGSTSAGILVTDLYGPGTAATITGNTLTGNSEGIAVGYNTSDASVVVAHNNCIFGNAWGVTTTAPAVDATANWWGSVNGPAHASNTWNVGLQGNPVSDNVAFVQWLASCGGPLYAGPVWTDTPDTQYFSSIQAGVNYATGGTVWAGFGLGAGTFTEQVVVNKSVALQGNVNTTILAPAAASRSHFTLAESAVTFDPVVIAFGGTESGGAISGAGTIDFDMNGFHVDGNNDAQAGYRYAGILLRNIKPVSPATSDIAVNVVSGLAPAAGNPETGGILLYGDSDAIISSNHVSSHTRIGIVAIGDDGAHPAPTANIHHNTVAGLGATGVGSWAENGIQISRGATGSIHDNTVTDHSFAGSSSYAASSIMVADAGGSVSVYGNTVTDGQAGVYWMTSSGSITGNTIQITYDVPVCTPCNGEIDGIIVDPGDGGNKAVPPSPLDGLGDRGAAGSPEATYTVVANDNVLTGRPSVGSYDTVGMWALAFGTDTLDFSGVRNTATGWDDGVIFYHDSTATLTVHDFEDNCFYDNTYYGAYSYGPDTIDVTNNYWGSANGPTHASNLFNVGAQGDAVSDSLTFVPWLDACGGASFAPVTTDTPAGEFASIQAGIDYATGGNVTAAAGTFLEQVVIDGKAVTVQGAGMNSTIVKSPADLATCFTTTRTHCPVIYIHNINGVTIQNLEVDGDGKGNLNQHFEGIGFWNASGTVSYVRIHNILDTPLNSADVANGLYAYSDGTTARAFNVNHCDVHDFAKTGLVFNAADTTPMTVDVQYNTITGRGILTIGDLAQNGIQVWDDVATGTIANNTISAIAYDNTLEPVHKWVATSILNYYAELDIHHNTITLGHEGIYNNRASSTIHHNTISVLKVGVASTGIDATDPVDRVPAPTDIENARVEITRGGAPEALTVSVTDNTVTLNGTDKPGTFGVYGWAGDSNENLALTVSNNIVTGFWGGITFEKCLSNCGTGVFTSMTAENNDLSNNGWPGHDTSNGWGMCSNVVTPVVLGTNNWWGDNSGPYHTSNPTGLGSAVCDYITFSPWQGGGLGNPMHVIWMSISGNPVPRRWVITYVQIGDASHQPVPNPTIATELTWPDGHKTQHSLAANTYGLAKFIVFDTTQAGTYTMCVTNVTKSGWLYDSASNHYTCLSVTLSARMGELPGEW